MYSTFWESGKLERYFDADGEAKEILGIVTFKFCVDVQFRAFILSFLIDALWYLVSSLSERMDPSLKCCCLFSSTSKLHFVSISYISIKFYFIFEIWFI